MDVFLLFAVKLAFEKILITVLFWKRFIFLSLVYAYVHKCACAPGSQRRSLDALFVSCLVWVLRIKLQSSARDRALNR